MKKIAITGENLIFFVKLDSSYSEKKIAALTRLPCFSKVYFRIPKFTDNYSVFPILLYLLNLLSVILPASAHGYWLAKSYNFQNQAIVENKHCHKWGLNDRKLRVYKILRLKRKLISSKLNFLNLG